MIHSAEKRAMSASATVLACLGRAQSEELPHTFPILRTWVRCGVMSRISKEAHRRDLTGFVVSVFRILDRFGPRASATQPKIPSNRRCHPHGWPNPWPLSHSGKDWRRGHGRSPIPFPVKILRQESRRGQPGLRVDSRGIAVQNGKQCPRRAGLSALSHRDAEPNPKPPAKTRFTCDAWCE